MILVTGAGGLIGSAAVDFFAGAGESVIGIENNSRREFFGYGGDISLNLNRLERKYDSFINFGIDIREYEQVLALFSKYRPKIIIHTAAQPSHDKAAEFPLIDFDVNARGTLNLLEAYRLTVPDSIFIHLSTNKVYGDHPNRILLTESEKRFDFMDTAFLNGVDETLPIDNSMHSLFGASKLASDIYAQEYGRYFGLKVGIFRGGCLTGPNHSGVEKHGFLSYLVYAAINGIPYKIFGYKGKQVRDQIHSKDVVNAIRFFCDNPKNGEVYNLGGGKSNSASVIESIELVSKRLSKQIHFELIEKPRVGDHICYYTNMHKFKKDNPSFELEYDLEAIVDDLVSTQLAK